MQHSFTIIRNDGEETLIQNQNRIWTEVDVVFASEAILDFIMNEDGSLFDK